MASYQLSDRLITDTNCKIEDEDEERIQFRESNLEKKLC